MTALLYILGMLSLCVTAGIGLLTIFYWVKPAKEPADTSNRINNITSWWIGLTRPDVLAQSYKFFRQDTLDNIIDVDKNTES